MGKVFANGVLVGAAFVFKLTVFDRAAADDHAVRQADQVGVFEFNARAFVALVHQHGKAGRFQSGAHVIGGFFNVRIGVVVNGD